MEGLQVPQSRGGDAYGHRKKASVGEELSDEIKKQTVRRRLLATSLTISEAEVRTLLTRW